MLGRAYNRAIQLAVVPGVADTQCGAKAARVALWQQILPNCHEDGFAWDVEIIALARHLDIPVQEVGIVWRHQDGSRVKPLRDGAQMLRAIPRIRMNVASARRTAHALTPTDGGVFADDNAARLASADANHWWFRSKATFVSLLIRRFANDPDFLVDVGSGSGGVTAMLGLPPSRALALDGNIELVTASRQRHALLTTACDVTAVPLRDGVASVACLLDVIEHLVDPTLALHEVARIVGRDNYLIVNVPAHQWLWSDADRLLGHERRYTRRTLRRELERNGFEVVWISHVFSWLVLPVWVMRRNTSSSEAKLGLGVSSPLISYLSMFLTRLETFVTRWISLPLGTSVLCVARVLGDPDTTENSVITDRGEAMFALQQTLYTSRNPTRRTLHCTRRDWIIDAIGRYGTGVQRALEVGPGAGVYLPTLTSTPRHVVALDIESAYLDRLVGLRCEHDSLQLVQDDITRSSFADGSFDLVVCSEVVEHIRDSTAALREMRRILTDDGTLILSTPQRYSTLEVASAAAFLPGLIQVARRVYNEPVMKAGHINLLTRRKLREQLGNTGFVPVEEWVSGMYLPGVAEALGTRALSIQAACERKIRGTRLEHALWTQFVVARPSIGG